jgi:hypothetical protein
LGESSIAYLFWRATNMKVLNHVFQLFFLFLLLFDVDGI